MSDIMIYGATGYTGRLIAAHAVERGMQPVLAGRTAKTIGAFAAHLGVTHRAFALDNPDAVTRELGGIAAVLNAAGPFSATARPMAEACLAAGVHYLDITGEIDVFEDLARMDSQAEAAGIMLLPGVGFDVVPSDCLAAHVAARMPSATRLCLSIGGLTRASRGTAKTMVEAIAAGTRVRSNGRIVRAAGTPRGTADFGDGPRLTVGVSWGDVSTAWHSTGIANVEVFFEADQAVRLAAATPNVVKAFLGTRAMQRVFRAQIERRLPPGPTEVQREQGRAAVIAEAWNAAGEHVMSQLVTPEPYALTVLTSVEVVRRVAAGGAMPGFQTPSKVFGADFITAFAGVGREDL